MKICSLRNKHNLPRCVFSDIRNRKFPAEKTVSPCAECVTFSLARIKCHLTAGIPFGGMPLSLLHRFLQWPSLDGKTERCGYMTGNWSRFSNYQMPGSPVFSINFTNRLKYLMSIGNSQAILKYFIDLKSETSVNQTRLEIYKAFQDRLTILNRLIGEIY